MKEKLTFEVPKPKAEVRESRPVRSSASFYNMVDLIQIKTGLTMVEITRRIAEYLNDRLEFMEKEDD